jgi:hypothetical protein
MPPATKAITKLAARSDPMAEPSMVTPGATSEVPGDAGGAQIAAPDPARPPTPTRAAKTTTERPTSTRRIALPPARRRTGARSRDAARAPRLAPPLGAALPMNLAPA